MLSSNREAKKYMCWGKISSGQEKQNRTVGSHLRWDLCILMLIDEDIPLVKESRGPAKKGVNHLRKKIWDYKWEPVVLATVMAVGTSNSISSFRKILVVPKALGNTRETTNN